MTTDDAPTPLGRVPGVHRDGLLRFTGIPYAQPPVGALRFAAPEPVTPWRGVLDATRAAVVAPQGPSRLVAAVGDVTAAQNEDCLHVSVVTGATDGVRRPVLVWLHGGGYSSGGGALDWYDGATLARDGDVVVVGVNYRLGPLGYLRVEGAGDGDAGLRDMIEALHWVQDNIAAFGGDPDDVTVFGQSAGAHSTQLMLTMPEVRGQLRPLRRPGRRPALAPLRPPPTNDDLRRPHGRGRRPRRHRFLTPSISNHERNAPCDQQP